MQRKPLLMLTPLRVVPPLILVGSIAACTGNEETEQIGSSKHGVEFTEFGISLYGKFRFESEGELFDIIDNDSTILISAGAVLTCIRRTYTVGYFAGGATITEGEKSQVIPKVFFVLKPSGEVTYHAPSSDGNFFGEQLPNSIAFGTLYEPHAEQGATERPAGVSESKPNGRKKTGSK